MPAHEIASIGIMNQHKIEEYYPMQIGMCRSKYEENKKSYYSNFVFDFVTDDCR